ncbi:phosphotransferase [Streptomyces sp. DSM 42041]|uniref:Maltokinase n=1 Tax=Streptomyces hazeniae TaxID=3075538 RepID=A0ABU2NUX3_9ACTN|nr:phosphotransferase [Streptomyces sp. DSM 42041]MDT0380760.1 phosphotransferase [Streptomyces sp. DSM 42041]
MSERSLPLAAPAAAPAAPRERGTALLRSLTPLLAEWLPRQRWFAGKGRPLGDLTLVSATELLPVPGPDGTAPNADGGIDPAPAGLLHLLVRTRSGPSAADRTVDCYQLLLGVRAVLPPDLAPAHIGTPAAGPLRGRTVYEALHDPRLAGVLLERLRSPGRLGPLRFTHGASGAVIPADLPARLLAAEQSNSSVVYGSSHILKLFRRVGHGVNPDLELPLALARHGCDRVPAPTAWFEAEPEAGRSPGLTLGVLQPFLPGSGDGWQLALRTLAARADFTGAAHGLGRATAEVHAGLASALPTTVLRRPQLLRLAESMTERLNHAAGAVPALRPYRDGLREAYGALTDLARRGQTRTAQRIHGDLHLGQALHTPADGRWTLIDFEGEPARPLAERRRAQPVVRDVAGMLRSFDYAACHPRGSRAGCGDDGWAQDWAAANRAAYCEGYAAVSGTDPREDAALLRAFETDKAVYEVLYEARHRPAWLPVPMSAVRRLAASPADHR